MNPNTWNRPRVLLAAGAIVLAIGGAALGRTRAGAPPPLSDRAPETATAFEVARVLSESPPDVVIITLDDGRHPLVGALPLTSFGADEDEQVRQAPRARRVVLVGADAVRTDRIARRMLGDGREVRVLEGGQEAWDRAMDTDPPEPKAGAGEVARAKYLEEVALRRRFGEKSAAPKVVDVVKVQAPTMAPSAPAKKREGC